MDYWKGLTPYRNCGLRITPHFTALAALMRHIGDYCEPEDFALPQGSMDAVINDSPEMPFWCHHPVEGLPTDADRLDVPDGLLLSALWDATFDRGLVTVYDEGRPQFSLALSEAGRGELR